MMESSQVEGKMRMVEHITLCFFYIQWEVTNILVSSPGPISLCGLSGYLPYLSIDLKGIWKPGSDQEMKDKEGRGGEGPGNSPLKGMGKLGAFRVKKKKLLPHPSLSQKCLKYKERYSPHRTVLTQ